MSDCCMGTPQIAGFGKERRQPVAVRVESWRRRSAQGACSLLVRLQSCALSSGSDRHRGWYAAGHADQRHGYAKPG